MRPKVIVSEMEVPPRRFAPWTPPVTSPATKNPTIGYPSALSTCALLSMSTPPIV